MAPRATPAPRPSRGSQLTAEAVARLKDESQNAVNARLGFPSGFLSRLISGHRKPGRHHAGVLFRELAVPLESWDQLPVPPTSGALPAEAHAPTGTHE